MKPRFWNLSYDITHPKRLRRVAKLAEENGERVQKSLFLCALSAEQLSALHRGLTQVITAEDKIMMRPLCRHCRENSRYQGAGGSPERREPFWIV
jgi:CRISPR-associated protein Cas2